MRLFRPSALSVTTLVVFVAHFFVTLHIMLIYLNLGSHPLGDLLAVTMWVILNILVLLINNHFDKK